MIAKSHRWQLTAIAAATLMGLWGTPANALSLGRVNVQSALGQPLRAEIDILDINAEEAATLSAKVAAPEAFKTAGLDYNAAMTGLQATLQRRQNGRAYLRLSSERAINEPFVDMILEASWSTGRIVRDYTMLFDPPGANAVAAVTITPAQAPQPARTAPAAVPSTAEVKQPLAPAPAQAKPAKPAPAPKTPEAQKVADTETQRIVVKPGETAGRIAAGNKPANVSLDQMLVALLRTNPDAFIGDNVNRIKAGALVTLPTEAQATGTSTTQASQIIIAQSNDFNEFRRKLAGSAPTTQVTPSSREVSGKLQASVEDKKPSATTPDKLTLSKGAVTGKSTEDQLAQAKNAKATADRATELAKNLQDLSKIAAASSAAAPVASIAKPAAATPPVSAAVPAPTLAPVVPVVAPPVTVASMPAPAISAAATPASASVVASAPAKPASKAVPAPAPIAAEPSLVDNLLEEPLVPAGALGLIALLAAFGLYKAKQRKKALLQDSSFGESRLQAESFFGSSGGQDVDTSDAASTGSSMIYSPSQLDAVDDVDPVAEADVYLAYGRDLQAEEILKDALRTRPERLAIHQKLLEIYAKRRDAKAFESIATLAFNLTNGIGPEWEQMCDMGLALDPDNALYLPGGQPFADLGAPSRPAALGSALSALASDQATAPTDLDFATTGNSELDLDLDFSLDEPDLPDGPALSVATALPEAPALPDVPESEASEMDFGTLDSVMPPAAASDTGWAAPEQPTEPAWLAEPSASAPNATVPMPLSLEMEIEDDDPFGKTQVLSAAPKPEKPANDSGMMEFDLGSLSLDFAMTKPGELSDAGGAASPLKLESFEEPETEAGAFMDATDDPLETKLALADEFKAIGDDDGARALIEEVIAEASGEMKAKAQRALKQL